MMKSTGLKLAAISAFAFGLAVAMSANANDPGFWTRCWQETQQCLQILPASQHNLCYDHYNACAQYSCGGMEP